jgi:hypothetical protein
MFRKPTSIILLTYDKSTKKASIFIEGIEDKSILKYSIESKTRHLEKTAIENSSLEVIIKNLNSSNSTKLIDQENISHKKYIVTEHDAEILNDLLDSKAGKHIDSDHIDNFKGVMAEVHELDWAKRSLSDIGISVDKTDFRPNESRCLIM